MSQNVQIGISKFHGIWTLALTDTVTLKVTLHRIGEKRVWGK